MSDFFATLVVLLVFWMVLVGGGIAAALWAMRRRNRVHPKHRTEAPLGWLWSPSKGAIQHRRLRSMVTWMSSINDPSTDMALRDRLVAQAIVLDREVVTAARAPKAHRAAALATVTTQVDRLDRLAVRLRTIAYQTQQVHQAPPAVPPTQQVARELDAIDSAIDSFESAQALVDQIDQQRTLEEVERSARQPGPPREVA